MSDKPLFTPEQEKEIASIKHWKLCDTCHKRISTLYKHGDCEDCANKKIWIADRRALSMVDRIEKIEEFIYYHGAHYKGPVRYGG
jgi:Zn finger protein HypA/HybF involved in hydrogenase expression